MLFAIFDHLLYLLHHELLLLVLWLRLYHRHLSSGRVTNSRISVIISDLMILGLLLWDAGTHFLGLMCDIDKSLRWSLFLLIERPGGYWSSHLICVLVAWSIDHICSIGTWSVQLLFSISDRASIVCIYEFHLCLLVLLAWIRWVVAGSPCAWSTHGASSTVYFGVAFGHKRRRWLQIVIAL